MFGKKKEENKAKKLEMELEERMKGINRLMDQIDALNERMLHKAERIRQL